VLQPSKLLPLLLQPTFAPSLVHLSAHPPSLLTYLAKDYLTPPPPLSHEAKFWGVFLPVSERSYDTDRLVFGVDGEGSGSSSEMVVEILIRGLNVSGRKRGVERVLEGWSTFNGACDLMTLESLKGIGSKRAIEEVDVLLLSFLIMLTLSSFLRT
jgi:elongator complex protein 5